ncbi:MAG: spore germination protein [Oscillospiraceae bacterium]|nr:spore germination protein [Oscillospiraceae bacterium]
MKKADLAGEIEALFTGSDDFCSRIVTFGGVGGRQCRIMYIDGLVSTAELARQVLEPLGDRQRFPEELAWESCFDLAARGGLSGAQVRDRRTAAETAADLLEGCCALVRGGRALTAEVKSGERRSVEATKEEKVLKGSRDAFTETLRVNTALVRRRIKRADLQVREIQVGTFAPTPAAVLWLGDGPGPRLAEETVRRLESIKTEAALSAAVFEENLADCPLSPFPQTMVTERPDKTALNLLEGRVAVLAEGLPMAFLVPVTFSQLMKAPEDNAQHFIPASLTTLMRYFAALLAVVTPAFYVAMAVFHREMLPVGLMQSIIDAKRFVPFPTALEVIFMLLAFDLVEEAGLRLPSPVGSTVSIVGALIVGQSAVEARVVSPLVVVSVALSGIAAYAIPSRDMSAALRLVRFGLVALASFLGMFGISLGLCLTLYHLAGLTSLSMPYMSPFEPPGRAERALFRISMRRKKEADPDLWQKE